MKYLIIMEGHDLILNTNHFEEVENYCETQHWFKHQRVHGVVCLDTSKQFRFNPDGDRALTPA